MGILAGCCWYNGEAGSLSVKTTAYMGAWLCCQYWKRTDGTKVYFCLQISFSFGYHALSDILKIYCQLIFFFFVMPSLIVRHDKPC
jgi:hypothetical protein